MRIVKKTSYEIICVNREEREKNKKKMKTQINYIKVFLNFKSEIKLKEEKKDLMNTITDVYAACINAAHNEKKTAEQSSTEKLIQNKCY